MKTKLNPKYTLGVYLHRLVLYTFGKLIYWKFTKTSGMSTRYVLWSVTVRFKMLLQFGPLLVRRCLCLPTSVIAMYLILQCKILIFLKKKLGMVACSFSPSYLGAEVGGALEARISRLQCTMVTLMKSHCTPVWTACETHL